MVPSTLLRFNWKNIPTHSLSAAMNRFKKHQMKRICSFGTPIEDMEFRAPPDPKPSNLNIMQTFLLYCFTNPYIALLNTLETITAPAIRRKKN